MTTSVEHAERAPGTGGPIGSDPGRRRLSPGRIAVLVVALAALVAAVVISRDRGPTPLAPGAAQPPTATGEDELPIDPLTGMPEGYRKYRDEVTGFTLAHPETWVPVARPDANRRLLLNAGGENSLSVRYNLNDEPFDVEADLDAMLTTTQRIVEGGGAKVVKRQGFNMRGMDGITYLSRFTNPETGRTHVNAHYFLFQGRKMFILLFQAAPLPPVEPEDEFERMLPHINAILDSFTIEPGDPSPAPAGVPEAAPSAGG